VLGVPAPELEPIARRLSARDPDARFASADAVLEALEAPPELAPGRPKAFALGLASTMVAAGLALAILFAWPSPPSSVPNRSPPEAPAAAGRAPDGAEAAGENGADRDADRGAFAPTAPEDPAPPASEDAAAPRPEVPASPPPGTATATESSPAVVPQPGASRAARRPNPANARRPEPSRPAGERAGPRRRSVDRANEPTSPLRRDEAPPTAEGLQALYRDVGQRLDALDASGHPAASRLRTRYFAVPLLRALTDAALRAAAEEQLIRIDREARRAASAGGEDAGTRRSRAPATPGQR